LIPLFVQGNFAVLQDKILGQAGAEDAGVDEPVFNIDFSIMSVAADIDLIFLENFAQSFFKLNAKPSEDKVNKFPSVFFYHKVMKCSHRVLD